VAAGDISGSGSAAQVVVDAVLINNVTIKILDKNFITLIIYVKRHRCKQYTLVVPEKLFDAAKLRRLP
jgi:hypothetical protein